VTGITPNSGLATGTIAITELTGTWFRPGAMVRLMKAGRADINATDVIVPTSNRITCSVNIAGAVYGRWDVVVTNTEGLYGAPANGFTITWNASTVTGVSPNQGLAP
jgi:hypothetical protein